MIHILQMWAVFFLLCWRNRCAVSDWLHALLWAELVLTPGSPVLTLVLGAAGTPRAALGRKLDFPSTVTLLQINWKCYFWPWMATVHQGVDLSAQFPDEESFLGFLVTLYWTSCHSPVLPSPSPVIPSMPRMFADPGSQSHSHNSEIQKALKSKNLFWNSFECKTCSDLNLFGGKTPEMTWVCLLFVFIPHGVYIHTAHCPHSNVVVYGILPKSLICISQDLGRKRWDTQ